MLVNRNPGGFILSIWFFRYPGIGYFFKLTTFAKNRFLNYLNVENISKSFGERLLFEGISFSIHKDQKIGFVAQNGTGKTTILNILTGKDQPDSGSIIYRNYIQVAYLTQNPGLDENISVEETIFASDNPILEVIKQYHSALENADDGQAYQKAFDNMDRHRAWDFETQYRHILTLLNLNNLDQKVSQLSGGQKRRLALAHALLTKPDLLILDEPTNHLDLDMIEWLEDFFIRENITLFMVTHDRYFLDRVCNEILELDAGKIFTYKGNYSYFLEQKEARHQQEDIETAKAKQLYKKELEWMRRQPKARTSKSKSRIDDFKDIKSRAQQRRKEHRVQLELNMERLGTKVVELHNISKSYGDKVLLEKFDYVFKRGERIGIIGHNGTGKTTFLNLVSAASKPDSGKVVIGETVKFGYYSQSGIQVDPGKKVIDVIRAYGDYIPLKKGRQISAQQLLERFMFDRKQQYDYVEKLSGGERKRLYLCTVLIQNPNFLILDEPTNDLDIITLTVLEEFLMDFPGCILIVSHDRFFMDKIVDHLFVFRGNGLIDDFPGNYSDFRALEEKKGRQAKPTSEKAKKTWVKDKNKLTYNEQRELKELDGLIHKLEIEKAKIQEKFQGGDLNPDEIRALSHDLGTIHEQLEDAEIRWFELQEKLES